MLAPTSRPQATLTATMAMHTLTACRSPCPLQPELNIGQWCLAQYSLDQCWYRACVERVLPLSSQYEVFFIDYGNR